MKSNLYFQTLFDKQQNAANSKDDLTAGIDLPDIDDVLGQGKKDGGKKAAAGGGGDKRLSVERIYQKKTQLEHILLRPDTYIGSVETVTQVNEYCI